MIDINSKIMFDIKNGSSNIDQAITTAIEYEKLGYKKVVNASEISLNNRILTSEEKQLLIDRVNEELNYQKIDFQILSGNLMTCDPKMLELLRDGLVSSLNYSRYVLLELPSTAEYQGLNRFIYDIQILGYVPIIVHPEIYKYVQEDTDYLLSLKERDCLIQLNINSINKSKSNRIYKCAKELLDRKMVDIVATETENAYDGEDVIRTGLKSLRKMVDTDYFDLMMKLNPQLIIDDERIDRIPPLDKKRGAFSRLFKKRG